MPEIITLTHHANFHAIFVMGLIVFALFLFASEKIPLASSSLLVLVILILFQLPFLLLMELYVDLQT